MELVPIYFLAAGIVTLVSYRVLPKPKRVKILNFIQGMDK